MPAITEEVYGHYRIKVGRLSGNWVARAFPKPPVKTRGLVAEASGDSEAAAMEALKSMIDERDAEWSANRRWEVRSGLAVPMEEEFTEALQQANLTGAQVAILLALAFSGHAGQSGIQLAKAAGYKSRLAGEKAFKGAGALLAAYIGIDLDSSDTPSGDGTARIIAFQEAPPDQTEAPVWIMHGELSNAVKAVL